MELPIQIKFFKKIDLYQEYKSEERKFKVSGTKLQCWKAEKKILKWTATEHHHLGSALTNQRIKEDILANQYTHEYEHAIQGLVQRKYAEAVDQPEAGIKVTKEGLLMGEVINEVENDNLLSKWRYQLKYVGFFALVWLTAIAGALIVIINLLKLLIPIFEHLVTWISQRSIC